MALQYKAVSPLKTQDKASDQTPEESAFTGNQVGWVLDWMAVVSKEWRFHRTTIRFWSK